MTPRRKLSKPPIRTPKVLVVGRIRGRIPTIRNVLERYGVTTSTLAWKASASGLWRTGAIAPDVIVVDIPAPVSAAHVEVLQRFRDRWEHAPQIVITTGASSSVLTSLLAVGVDDFVANEDVWGELIVRVRRQLRQVAPMAMPAVVGPEVIQLDAANRTVTAHGRVANLTQREFDVFRCLTERGGEAISREEILRRVWGTSKVTHSTSGAGIVGVYVLYLRRKLTKLGLTHALCTIKGRGYSFQAPSDYWAPARKSAALAARGSRTGTRDLYSTADARTAATGDDDFDIATQPQQNADQSVRRKAL